MKPIDAAGQNDLKQKWAIARETNPDLRIREAAESLQVSEAELLATDVGGNVVRLAGECAEIVAQLPALRRIMALTRNDEIVHERKGEYGKVEIMRGHGTMGLVLGEAIDLRIFFDRWHFAFAVAGESARGATGSFQFFDRSGTAIHKVFLTETSDFAAYEKLIEKYRSADQSPTIEVQPKTEKPSETSDAEIDADGFRRAWANLKDTHDFFPLLRKFGVAREQALRLADREMARQVGADSFKFVLEAASERRLPMMIFVGNPGIIQIHTGAVERLSDTGGWFNVLDEPFNLHINQEKIARAWIVKKPTVDGTVTSLELFNDAGENVALFFGKRKPGTTESADWRALIEDIPN